MSPTNENTKKIYIKRKKTAQICRKFSATFYIKIDVESFPQLSTSKSIAQRLEFSFTKEASYQNAPYRNWITTFTLDENKPAINGDKRWSIIQPSSKNSTD